MVIRWFPTVQLLTLCLNVIAGILVDRMAHVQQKSGNLVRYSDMVGRRSRAQPASPADGSAASTPKGGRRLTPASATPTRRQVAQSAPNMGGGAKDSKKRKVAIEDDVEDQEPPTPSEATSSSDNDSEDAFDPDSSASEEELAEDEAESEVDSDFLDEPEDEQKKRKSTGGTSIRPAKKASSSTRKGQQAVKIDDDDDEDEDAELSDVELEEGQVIAGRIYPAPTNGQGQLTDCSDCFRAERNSIAGTHIS